MSNERDDPAVRAVLFDFAGVLTQPISEAFAVCAARAGVDEGLLRSVLVPMFMSAEDTDLPAHRLERGEISLEAFLATLDDDAAPVRRLLDPSSLSFVVGEFQPSLPMQRFAQELGAAGIKTAVVSNTVREWLPAWEAGLTDPASLRRARLLVGDRSPEAEPGDLRDDAVEARGPARGGAGPRRLAGQRHGRT